MRKLHYDAVFGDGKIRKDKCSQRRGAEFAEEERRKARSGDRINEKRSEPRVESLA